MSLRVTSSMINAHSKTNINSVKVLTDLYNGQMTSQKKIDKPSDDPVIAIRSLRLKDSLSEVTQYTEKNIPDAESWLSVTETSLKKMSEVLKDVYNLCVNGSTGTLTTDDRNTIIKNLKAYVEQIYAEGDSEYAGRTVFTGYKTNKTLCFPSDTAISDYVITEKFTPDDFAKKNYYSDRLVLPADSSAMVTGTYPELTDEIKETEFSRFRLAYSGIMHDTVAHVNVVPATPGIPDLHVETIDMATFENQGYSFLAPANAYLIEDTGEIVFSDDAMALINAAKTADPDISFAITYEKKGFMKGEVRPEMYFDCHDVVNDIEYNREEQFIGYTVAANLDLEVNTQASQDGVLTTGIKRDIDDLLNAVTLAQKASDKVKRIKVLQENANYQDADSQARLKEWREAAEKEETYCIKNLQGLLSNGITKFQGYKDTVDLAVTDVGSRQARLKLTKSRMDAQQSTIKSLIHTNEDRALSDILIDYKAAYEAYQASLTAASKVGEMTLLNYL